VLITVHHGIRVHVRLHDDLESFLRSATERLELRRKSKDLLISFKKSFKESLVSVQRVGNDLLKSPQGRQNAGLLTTSMLLVITAIYSDSFCLISSALAYR
jgi:hypothetical protein